MKRTIRLDWLPPGLNGPKGLMRMHHRAKSTLLANATLEMLSFIGGRPHKPLGPATCTYTRHSTKAMDWDNLGASFKVLGDALIGAGVIVDDSPEWIVTLDCRQVRVRKRAEQHVTIELEEVASC